MALFFSNANLPVPALPTIGVGLRWYYASSTTISLYSDHPSGSCFVPCFNASTGEAVIVEIPAASLPMSLNLGSSGAGGLDTGSVAADKFYCVRMIAKADGGSPALLATLNAGTPTIPAAYAGGVQSDIIWGVSCSVDYDSSGATDEISAFIQTAPGACRYSTGGGGYVGYGLTALSEGAATSSTAIDLSHLVPAPVADTRQETIGTALIGYYAQNNHATTRVGHIYHSADGRTDADANDEDALESVFYVGRLDSASAAGGRDEGGAFDFPIALSKTSTDYGFTTTSTGTLANCMQYKWTGAADCKLTIYVRGWTING